MITLDYLKERLSYDPDTGVFTWISGSDRYFGHPAGVGGKLRLDGKLYRTHRLAWLYMTGDWPEFTIDHIDGNRSNNSWENLRDVPQSVNCKNKARISGVPGVFWFERTGRWLAYITVNYQRIYLGYFKEYEDACRARKSAENAHGFHANHGRAKCV